MVGDRRRGRGARVEVTRVVLMAYGVAAPLKTHGILSKFTTSAGVSNKKCDEISQLERRLREVGEIVNQPSRRQSNVKRTWIGFGASASVAHRGIGDGSVCVFQRPFRWHGRLFGTSINC